MPQLPARKRTYMRAYMLKKRNGRQNRPESAPCAICGDVVSGKSLHYDHDHQTGKFRGWLCGPCNAGIGMFRDNPTSLAQAISYLGGS